MNSVFKDLTKKFGHIIKNLYVDLKDKNIDEKTLNRSKCKRSAQFFLFLDILTELSVLRLLHDSKSNGLFLVYICL